VKKIVYLLALLTLSSFTAAMDFDKNQDTREQEIEDQDRDSLEIDHEEINNLCGSLTSEPQSCAAYLLSTPAKSLIMGTFKLMDFVMRNEQTLMIMSACLASQIPSAAAACNCTRECGICMCWYYTGTVGHFGEIGKAYGAGDCINICKSLNRTFGFCK